MRAKEIVHIPARDAEHQVTIICDLCGRRSTEPEHWATERFAVAETTITYKYGTSYPDNGAGEQYRVDLCPTCFLEKLIPWLKSQGAAPTPHEWEWSS